MARLKTKIISINGFQCKEAFINELKSQIDSRNYDFNKVFIYIKGKSPPPFIANIDRAIESLERYYICNKHLIQTFNSEQIIRRKQLAKMLGISRPTLNKWIYHGFIQPVPLRCMQGETFPVQDVLKQLIAYKNKK
jgi:predicted DNA-binding transcriptional regulator AlpA